MSDNRFIRDGLPFAANKMTEECGELIAALGKSFCYGWESYNPDLPISSREYNHDWVMRELLDVLEAGNRLKQELEKTFN